LYDDARIYKTLYLDIILIISMIHNESLRLIVQNNTETRKPEKSP